VEKATTGMRQVFGDGMVRKDVRVVFILILLPLAQMVQAQPQSSDVGKIAKVKSEIAKRVANKKMRVKIKLPKFFHRPYSRLDAHLLPFNQQPRTQST
jgi:hypothetical protein